MAALLLVLANQFILWGVQVTPFTLGIVLTLVALVVLFLVPRNDLVSFTLSFRGARERMLTHQGTGAYTAIVLVVAIAVFAIIRRGARGATNGHETQNAKALTLHLWPLAAVVTSFVGVLIGYWILLGGVAAQRFFTIVLTGANPSSFAAQPLEAPAAATLLTGGIHALSPSSLALYNDLSALLLILFATVGLLYLIEQGKEKRSPSRGPGFRSHAHDHRGYLFCGRDSNSTWTMDCALLNVYGHTPAVAILALGTQFERSKRTRIDFFSGAHPFCYQHN